MMTIYFASYLLAATVLTKNVANGAVFYQILEKDPGKFYSFKSWQKNVGIKGIFVSFL